MRLLISCHWNKWKIPIPMNNQRMIMLTPKIANLKSMLLWLTLPMGVCIQFANIKSQMWLLVLRSHPLLAQTIATHTINAIMVPSMSVRERKTKQLTLFQQTLTKQLRRILKPVSWWMSPKSNCLEIWNCLIKQNNLLLIKMTPVMRWILLAVSRRFRKESHLDSHILMRTHHKRKVCKLLQVMSETLLHRSTHRRKHMLLNKEVSVSLMNFLLRMQFSHLLNMSISILIVTTIMKSLLLESSMLIEPPEERMSSSIPLSARTSLLNTSNQMKKWKNVWKLWKLGLLFLKQVNNNSLLEELLVTFSHLRALCAMQSLHFAFCPSRHGLISIF